MKACNSCGKQIDENIKFCPYCGGKQNCIDDDKATAENAKKIVFFSKKVFLIIAIFVLVAVGVVLLLRFDHKGTDVEIAEDQVTSFLTGYQQKDETISGFLVGAAEADSMSFEGISAYFANELKYQIRSCKKEEENLYSVEVQIQNIDFENLFLDSYQKTLDQYGEAGIADNFMSELEQDLEQKNYETDTFLCDVSVRKLNDEYKIQMDSSLANALTGGMTEYLKSLQEGE